MSKRRSVLTSEPRLIVPSNWLLTEQAIARAYEQGAIDKAREYNLIFAPLKNRASAAQNNWSITFNRIHEIGQSGAHGQAMIKRLEILGPELSKFATEYRDALIALKNARAGDPDNLDQVIEGVMLTTSTYQDIVKAILEGDSNGIDKLKNLHIGDHRAALFEPFDDGLHHGGAPSGMKPARKLIAQLAIENKGQTLHATATKVRTILEDWLKEHSEEHEDYALYHEAFTLVYGREFSDMGKYVGDIVKRYAKRIDR